MKTDQTIFRKIREQMHLTQIAMADRMGMARGSYINLESGRTAAVTDSVLKFCEVTGVSLLEIVEDCYPQYCGSLLKEDAHYKTMLKETVDDYEKRLDAKNAEIAHLTEKFNLLKEASDAQQKLLRFYEQPSVKND